MKRETIPVDNENQMVYRRSYPQQGGALPVWRLIGVGLLEGGKVVASPTFPHWR